MNLIDKGLLRQLHFEALAVERRRVAYDLRTTPDDDSQRMLNVLEPGTLVPIHQHKDTDETTFCIEGCLDVVFFREVEDGEFVEKSRVTLSPKEGNYGVQIPHGTWHTVEIYAPCTIFEAKDGKYVPQK